jgi:hypothetical protein
MNSSTSPISEVKVHEFVNVPHLRMRRNADNERLTSIEDEIRRRLAEVLPLVVVDGRPLFTNRDFNPHGLLPAHYGKTSDELQRTVPGGGEVEEPTEDRGPDGTIHALSWRLRRSGGLERPSPARTATAGRAAS